MIVESPAKAKTIERFLGSDFVVKSSFGHICDLAKKGLGIDVDNNFEPQYEISDDKRTVVAELKRLLIRPIRYGWLPMKTARERPLLGICLMCLN